MDEKYAFLMIDYETPKIIKELHDEIPEEELYLGDNGYNKFGKEKESHVTLVACLDNDTDLEDLKKYLKKLSDYKLILTDISKFECDEYDVLKCSAKSMILSDTNEEIRKHFETHTQFKDYKPHMTVAYMKHGMADKYCKEILSPLVKLTPVNFHYSWWENGELKQKTFKD